MVITGRTTKIGTADKRKNPSPATLEACTRRGSGSVLRALRTWQGNQLKVYVIYSSYSLAQESSREDRQISN